MLPTAMVYSDAWQGLTSTAKDFYLLLRGEARFYSNKNTKKTVPAGRNSMPTIKNNGELRLTYRQAKEILNKSNRSIADAVASLVERGFLDITRQGSGICKVETLYALSERWRRYGETGFIPHPPRPKRNTAGSEALVLKNRKRAEAAKSAKTTPRADAFEKLKDSRNGKATTVTAQMVDIYKDGVFIFFPTLRMRARCFGSSDCSGINMEQPGNLLHYGLL